MPDKLWEGFNKVDAEKDAQFYIQYLDTIRNLGDTQAYKEESFKKLNLKNGAAALDIGCGVGHDTQYLSEIVGRQGRVVGVDMSEYLLTEARKRAASKQLQIEYQQADIYALPFEDGSFDACRADRVFLYLDKPSVAIQQMVRVLKSGGVLYIRDPDMDTYLLDAPDLNKETSRAFTRFFSDSFANGIIGRQLRRLLQQHQLKNIHYEPKTLVIHNYNEANTMFGIERTISLIKNKNILSVKEIDEWHQQLMNADQQNNFTFSLTFFATYGNK